jgi:MFS family permease
MAGFSRTRRLDADEIAALRTPRQDIVAEELIDGRFVQAEGPFIRYERVVELVDDDGAETEPQQRTVRETVDFRLPPGTWRPLMHLVVRETLRRPPKVGRMPWWAPPQRTDPRGAQVLGLTAALAVVTGYVGTLLSQTMTFAADEFSVGNTAQGNVLAAARLGGVFAIGLTTMADKLGRRRILRAALLVCIASNLLGALTPSLFGLAVSQIVNRGAWAAAAVLLTIIVAEEMPAGARAYAISLLAMTGALGAGMALWVLPVADLGDRAWRVLYVVPLVMLPLVIRSCRRLPESRRFERPHLTLSLREHASRMVLLASTAFLLNVFMGPTTQFRSEFLRDERGFSAGALALFALVTSTPGGIGIVAGGRLAERVGRRIVGSVAIAVGVVFIAAQFSLSGPIMWVAATVGAIIFLAHVPAITVYGPELFPTSLRGRANGVITMSAMAGSVVGLLAAGRMADAFGSFAPTMAILAAAPLAMAVVIIKLFPETAHRELEDLNPEDLTPVPPATWVG